MNENERLGTQRLYALFERYPAVATDSRRAGEGTIFFALRGDRFDGNRFALAALDAGEDGFVPYGCIVSEGKVPAVVGAGEVPVFAIIAPELLEGIGSPLRELLGSVCAAA